MSRLSCSVSRTPHNGSAKRPWQARPRALYVLHIVVARAADDHCVQLHPHGRHYTAFKQYQFNRPSALGDVPILRFFGQMMNMKWVGLKWFENIFAKPDFWQAFRNTLFISFGRIVFEFPIPILLALLMNEMYHQRLKRVYQTVYTFPHFLSWVLVASLMNTLFLSDGTVNAIIKSLGGQPVRFLTDPVIFRPMLFITSIWKSAGWSSIIYMATISGIDPRCMRRRPLTGQQAAKLPLHHVAGAQAHGGYPAHPQVRQHPQRRL